MVATAEDRRILKRLIDQIGKLLKWIVFGEHKLLEKELKAEFITAWPEVEAAINRAKDDIQEVTSEKLEEAGLTGKQLALKNALFSRFWTKTKIPDDPKAGDSGVDFESGSILLDIAESLLGSLKHAFPYLEAVKEFMELVKAAMRHLRKGSEIIELGIAKKAFTALKKFFIRSKKAEPMQH